MDYGLKTNTHLPISKPYFVVDITHYCNFKLLKHLRIVHSTGVSIIA